MIDGFTLSADRAFRVARAFAAILLSCALLAGCASRGSLQYMSEAFEPVDITRSQDAGLPAAEKPSLANTTSEQIFVATNRQGLKRGDYSSDRIKQTQYADYEISIPPNHQVGKIEWPRNRPDPQKHFAVLEKKSVSKTQFLSRLNDAVDAAANSGRGDVTLYIHGYNTNFSESLYRVAQIKHDFAMDSPLVLYSWPSAGKTGLYVYDRDSIKISRERVVQMIDLISNSRAKSVTLVAHSMGSDLLMESLRQIALTNNGELPKKIEAVVLISPDLDIDVFNSQLASLKSLPKDFVVFASKHDVALQLSSFLSGDNERVGSNIDASSLDRDGITVIDVSDFEGGDDLNHFTVATSPSLVALLKGLKNSRSVALLKSEIQAASLPSSLVKSAVNGAKLPLRLVNKTTEAILAP